MIRQTTVVSNEDQQRLFRWSADPFGIAHLGLQWRPKETRFVMEIHGVVVSHVGLLRHPVRVGDGTVDVAGFGGVVTVPESQGLGHATALMKHAAAFAANDWRVQAGFLFCLPRMIPYYFGLGWRTVGDPVLIEQSSGVVPAPLPVMVLPLGGLAWPDGPVHLGSEPW